MGPTLTETPRTNWKVLGIVILAALVVRLAYGITLDIEYPIRADAQKYFLLAFNLVQNGVYSFGTALPLQPSTSITPGYPWFLASILYFSESLDGFLTSTMVLQTIISSLSCGLLFLIGQRILSTRLAALAAALFILSPHAIILSCYVLTETVFVFVCLLAVFLLCRSDETGHAGLYIVTGLTFGLAVLIRPGLLLFPLVAASVVLLQWTPRSFAWAKWKNVTLLLAAFAASLAPWMVWVNANKNDTETNAIAAQIALGSYPNLIHKQAAMQGYPYREDPAFAEMTKSVAASVDTVMARASEKPFSYLHWYLVGKPVMFHRAKILVGQGGAFIYPVERSLFDISSAASGIYSLMMRAHAFLVILAALTSVVTLVRVVRRQTAQGHLALALAAAIFVYFTVLHTVLAPLPRYSIPLHPFIYLLAIASLAEAIRRSGVRK